MDWNKGWIRQDAPSGGFGGSNDLNEAIQQFKASHDLLAVFRGCTSLRRTGATNGGEYHGPCPLCGGEDRFVVWPNDPEGPHAWCRHCERNGDVLRWSMLLDGHNPDTRGATAEYLRMCGLLPDRRASAATWRATPPQVQVVQAEKALDATAPARDDPVSVASGATPAVRPPATLIWRKDAPAFIVEALSHESDAIEVWQERAGVRHFDGQLPRFLADALALMDTFELTGSVRAAQSGDCQPQGDVPRVGVPRQAPRPCTISA